MNLYTYINGDKITNKQIRKNRENAFDFIKITHNHCPSMIMT